MSLPNKPPCVPRLCYVTDRRSLLRAESAQASNLLLEKISAAGANGVDWIHIREKDLSARACSSLTRDALRGAANSAANQGGRPRIFVNDRLDVALATQADGVHLGEPSLSPREARHLVKTLRRENDFLIGVSCHSLETAKAADESRADYIFFGPVFATPSKAAYGAPQGLERLAEVCRAVALPVLAIGGITLENAAACLSAGAAGIAAIRLFQEAPDMARIVRALRKLSA
jgi:thiamine-phosphate pyrophosphorylase